MANVDMEKIKSDTKKELSVSPKRITPDQVKQKGKNKMESNFFEIFFKDLWEEVVKPGLFDWASDIVYGTVDRAFEELPGRRRSGRGRRRSRRSHTSYERYYDDDDYDDYYEEKKRKYQRSDEFTEVPHLSREKCEKILRRMEEYIQDYGYVSVAQVKYVAASKYLSQVTSTDHKFGWTSMKQVDSYKSSGEYYIMMEDPRELD